MYLNFWNDTANLTKKSPITDISTPGQFPSGCSSARYPIKYTY